MSKINVATEYLLGVYSCTDKLIVNQELTPSQLVRIIRKASKEIFIKLSLERSYSALYDCVTFNAYHANWKDIPIEVVFIFHKDQKTIILGADEWDELKKYLISVILHEYKHNEQHSKRKHDMRAINDKEIIGAREEYFTDALYIGCPDEVDAYAYQTAVQLRMFYSLDTIKNILMNISRSPSINKNISRYMTIFKKGTVVRNRFFKKLYLYLNL